VAVGRICVSLFAVGVGEGQAVAGEVVAVAFQHGAGGAVAGVREVVKIVKGTGSLRLVRTAG
jgi:hypothetical protein